MGIPERGETTTNQATTSTTARPTCPTIATRCDCPTNSAATCTHSASTSISQPYGKCARAPEVGRGEGGEKEEKG